MRARSHPLDATFVDRYLQARRLLPANAPGRAPKGARVRRSDKRAVEAVTRAIRGGKA
jgi:hypothetical protein